MFRLNTGSENAAVETADSGDAMEIAREGGVYLPAVLRIEWRSRAEDGKPYPVPVLQIGKSMREVAERSLPGGLSGLMAQLQGPAPREERRAIAGGTPPAPAAEALADDDAAQRIATLAALAANRDDVEKLAAKAEADGVSGDYVTPEGADVMEQLGEYLRDRWRELPPAGEGQ